MPPVRLPERPKPPTGQEMLADVAGADDNDVVFVEGQAVDLADLTPSTPEGGLEGADRAALTQVALAQAEKREAAQRAYHRALELLQHEKTLEEAPSLLDVQFQHLSDLGQEMSKVIKELQESSSHVTQTQKEKAAPKASKANKKKR